MNKNEIKLKAANLMTKNTRLNYGQAIFLTAMALDPTVSDFKDSELDCSIDSDRVDLFLDRICTKESC